MNPLTPQLRAAYRASGLTIAQIAARAGVSEFTFYRMLHGRLGHVSSLIKVCVALNMPAITIPEQTNDD